MNALHHIKRWHALSFVIVAGGVFLFYASLLGEAYDTQGSYQMSESGIQVPDHGHPLLFDALYDVSSEEQVDGEYLVYPTLFGPIAASAVWSAINIVILIVVSLLFRLFLFRGGWIGKLVTIPFVVVAIPALCCAGFILVGQSPPLRIIMNADDIDRGAFFPQMNGLYYLLVNVSVVIFTNLAVCFVTIFGGRDSWIMRPALPSVRR